MPKAKKKKQSHRAAPYTAPKAMDVDEGMAAPEGVANLPTAAGEAPTFAFAAPEESNRQLFARQAREWKEMKARVAAMKRERKKIPKKGNKEKKKAVSKEIRRITAELQAKQQKELTEAGVIGTVQVPEGMDEDDDDL